jgi:hypothetical protein
MICIPDIERYDEETLFLWNRLTTLTNKETTSLFDNLGLTI